MPRRLLIALLMALLAAPSDGLARQCWQLSDFQESGLKDMGRCARAAPVCGAGRGVNPESFEARYYGVDVISRIPSECSPDISIHFGWSRECPELYEIGDRLVAMGLLKVVQCGGG